MSFSGTNPKFIAFYLPQYHPIPENDEWWGKGFTEWSNVTKAKPLFKGHYQPRLPTDLGFYDLRLAEIREQQAQLAKENGVHGFCYYHYWFGNGKQVLERPINEVIESGKPDLPFCFCWANESWEGRWYGVTNNKKTTLIKQEYPGEDDYRQHFAYLLKAFKDSRYITVDGKPLFQVFCPHLIPDAKKFSTLFRKLAAENGLPGIYLVGGQKTPFGWNPTENGFDAIMSTSFSHAINEAKPLEHKMLDFLWENKVSLKLFSKGKSMNKVTFYDYSNVVDCMNGVHEEETKNNYPVFPVVINDFDNTARAGKKGVVFMNSTPEMYREHVKAAIKTIEHFKPEERIIFIKSWNEWAEGNYLEPDSKFGHQYLDVIAHLMNKNGK